MSPVKRPVGTDRPTVDFVSPHLGTHGTTPAHYRVTFPDGDTIPVGAADVDAAVVDPTPEGGLAGLFARRCAEARRVARLVRATRAPQSRAA